MQELIKVTEENGKKLVSARELHEFLGVGKDFTTWIKGRITKYAFEENVDFTVVSIAPQNGGTNRGGQNKVDYAITVDMAKELSMVENNDKGREARRYFIQCEKDLNEVHQIAIEQKTVTLEEINKIRFKTPTKTCITFSNVDADFAKTLTKEFIEYAKTLSTDERIRKCQSAMNGLGKLHDRMAKISFANIGDCYNINTMIDEIKDIQHKAENMSRGQMIAHRNTKIKELESKLN